MSDFDVVVVGNGLFGSAAARHLAELGERVAIIGPGEPAEPARHDGVFASHYDQGRLTRLLDRDHFWVQITRRAVAGYPRLEQASGIRFHSPVGALVVGRPDASVGPVDDPLGMVRESGIEHRLYEPGDKSWQQRFEYLQFPSSHYVIHEPAPAGFINPRRLIRAQNKLAVDSGTTIIREVATAVASLRGRVVITTSSGATYRAAKVLVAAGAFTNFNHLLTDSLPLRLKTEVIVLARVSPLTAEVLQPMPTVKYATDAPELEGIYIVPPVRFPDGNHYLKIGANTVYDHKPTTLPEVQAWFRAGDSDVCLPAYQRALHSLFPAMEFSSYQTKRCIVCYTPTRDPIIDQVDDSVFVAAGGNGGGAKASDAWGELAAGLVHDGRWPADLRRLGPHE